MDFKSRFNTYAQTVNKSLDEIVALNNVPEKSILSAMKYSLMAGGKRLRPVLSLAVCEMLDGDKNEVLPYACAIEMIHTYSLIHDDLPSMDNDDYRRGMLTNHKVYGEAVAILAGDALLNLAFETMIGSAMINSNNPSLKIKAMGIIAKASGSTGMIAGQIVDIESEGKEISDDVLKYMHKCKTGEMIKASVMCSAILCDANDEELEMLNSYAEKIGLAFQIKDDILDVEGNIEKLGKQVGSDASNNKSTFVSLYGLEDSKKILDDITKDAIKSIEAFGNKGCFLKGLAEYLAIRDN